MLIKVRFVQMCAIENFASHYMPFELLSKASSTLTTCSQHLHGNLDVQWMLAHCHVTTRFALPKSISHMGNHLSKDRIACVMLK